MMKKLFSVLAVLIISVLMSATALAAAEIEFVKVNGDEVTDSSVGAPPLVLDVDRGDDLDIKIRLKSKFGDLEDVQIEAVLRGVDSRETVDDITDTFDMKANVSYTKTLSLPLIDKIDQDKYKLRIRISDRDSATVEKTYELDIGTQRHDVEVRDVVLSPSTEVKAGRALLVTARIRNRGDKNEDGVKVVVSIPDLGVSAADFIDELEKEGDNDDQATTEEMFLRIPDDAEAGEYEVVVDVFFDDLDKKNSYVTSIRVQGEESAAEEQPVKSDEKTIITIAADKQNAAKGQEVAYPIALTNAGASDKTYTVRADVAAWASFRVAPSNVLVIGAGESKALTVYASAGKDAPAGEQTFTVTISSNDKTLKQLPLGINVQESASGASTLKRGLEVGLVVLVILLVIIGLIIGFSKLRGEEEEGKEGKEYY